MIFNPTAGGSSGGSGSSTLTVTAPMNVTATVSKSGVTRSKTVDSSGTAVFKGLEAGTWSVTISDSTQTSAARTVEIVTDYNITVSFFSATIYVTCPAGSPVFCFQGTDWSDWSESTGLTGDTSGSYTFTVSSPGTYFVGARTTDWASSDYELVTISTSGQSVSVELSYYLYLYDKGNTCNSITGGWVAAQHSNGDSYPQGKLTLSSDCIITDATASAKYNVQARTSNKIDLTNYSTLYVKVESLTGGKQGVVTVSQNVWPNYLTTIEKTFSNAGIISVDISSLNGSFYVIAGVYFQQSYAKITQVYLEE